MYKKVISLFLTIVMIFSLSSIVFADSYDKNGVIYGCKTWNLSEQIYDDIAKIITREKGNLYDSCLIASNIANLFEAYNVSDDKRATLALKAWYGYTLIKLDDYKDPNAVKAVSNVFKSGVRYLPRYVCYFDDLYCFYKETQVIGKFFIDGKSASTKDEAQRNLNNAVPFKSIITNTFDKDNPINRVYITCTTKTRSPYVFYYNPEGMGANLYNKYKDDDKIFRVYSGSPVNVKINGKKMKTGYGNAFINSDDRTMVPIRVFAESFNFKVEWNGEKQTITIKNGAKNVVFTIDSYNYLVNGKRYKMDTVPYINPKEERTYVPLRFAAEALGATVTYNSSTSTAECVLK